MATSSDVLAAHIEATGTVVSGRWRVKGYQIAPGGTAGEIILRDGGASGTVRLQFNVTTNQATISTLVPGDGVLFRTDVHVTLPAAAEITVFYG